ncbi:DinB family protein [Saccharopolyspora gloriosae]|uniref:DinB family protein n=1 Tax=Saccharopolyspora gloriosae TaxID=455344 RepID=UPI001FB77AA8|nr:DinB family protein [Saccharopolyspora gloriosae]
MSTSRPELLRWQFELTWSLFEYHLERLDEADFRWEPTPYCWTLRQGADGGWAPDFAEVEPDPVPVPTIAWVAWHIGWWWSVTLDHLQGEPPRDHADIAWPGDGEPALTWLRSLRSDWLLVLDRLTERDLDDPAPFPWQNDPAMTIAHLAGWVNAELMKNAAEIGQLRMLRAAAGRGRTGDQVS